MTSARLGVIVVLVSCSSRDREPSPAPTTGEPPQLSEADKEDLVREVATQASAGVDAFLVVSDVYYAGWQALVDGQPTPLYRTNYILRGLIVPAGEHTVDLVFRPRSIFFGFAITLASVPVLILGMLRSRRSSLGPSGTSP